MNFIIFRNKPITGFVGIMVLIEIVPFKDFKFILKLRHILSVNNTSNYPSS